MEGKTKMALKKEISTSKVVLSVLSLPPSIKLHLKVLGSGTTTMVVVVLLVILLAMAGHSSGWYGVWTMEAFAVKQACKFAKGHALEKGPIFFGLGEEDWLSEMILAGKRFCGEEWSIETESEISNI